MKIPVLNGSPKAEGSDVMHITCAFIARICSPMRPEEVCARIVNSGV